MGILVKGGNYLEALAKTETVVFDKTGTLTEGRFEVAELNAENGFDKESVLFYAACAESLSTHPIALSIVNGYGRETDGHAQNISETAGKGVSATVDGHAVLAGNALLMRELGIEFKETVTSGTTVYVAVDGKFAGSIVIKDKIKRDSAQAIARLKTRESKTRLCFRGTTRRLRARLRKNGTGRGLRSAFARGQGGKTRRTVEKKDVGQNPCLRRRRLERRAGAGAGGRGHSHGRSRLGLGNRGG